MKILRLEMLNLASLDKEGGEIINFEEGSLNDTNIFSIVGPTGSGKSTILDAICLALYNKAPRYPRKKNAKDKFEILGESDDEEKYRLSAFDARNILTRGKKTGYSKLTFLANNGSVYRAEWYVNLKTKKFDSVITSLYKIFEEDGTIREEKADWDKLTEIIGLDYDQFLRTVLIAQGSFASFLKANEDERFELLEKLIGCEELYDNISKQIKEGLSDADNKHTEIAAQISAYEGNIIPEEELEGLCQKVTELQEKDKKNRELLLKVNQDLNWFLEKDKLVENIEEYVKKSEQATCKLEEFKESASRLQLHDETLEAVAIYNDIKNNIDSISSQKENVKKLGKEIEEKEEKLRIDQKVNLVNLQEEKEKAEAQLKKEKPFITRAREITIEINGLNKTLDERKKALKESEDAYEKSKAEYKKNIDDIDKLSNKARKLKEEEAEQIKKYQEEEKKHSEIIRKAADAYLLEKNKMDSFNAETLQQEKSTADKTLNDIVSALKVQKNISDRRNKESENLNRKKTLEEENENLEAELKKIDIDGLSEELEVLQHTVTLMTSEAWENHRKNLMAGEACPLCGATSHPYSNRETFLPVAEKMNELVKKKSEELRFKRNQKEEYSKKQATNKGKLDGIKKILNELAQELSGLNTEWENIYVLYPDWQPEVESLEALKPEIEENAEKAAQNLKIYNELVTKVESLRVEKETAENNKREWDGVQAESSMALKENIDETNLKIAEEKGKTANLDSQRVEKAINVETAEKALNSAVEELESKKNELKKQIGDKDPDKFETELNEAIDKAEKELNKKIDSIATQQAELRNIIGQASAFNSNIEKEKEKILVGEVKLSAWLKNYNHGKPVQLTESEIKELSEASDDWEAIRATQKNITNECVAAKTTLDNEKESLAKHEEKKPKEEKEELQNLKAELENYSNAELVEISARIQKHDDAKKAMGEIYEKKLKAQEYLNDWKEIWDAIGSNGRTLRKLAQCYTLRFLIEHANSEIRKFNSRYELQQVKNSLGIRVIDHDRADDVRDITSLSGGETFIVSLGLALGLSSLSSRNISFENLFIDEGFGTLDPDTLDTVIDSLSVLQTSQGKKVGVISHTDSMSERISTQIRVIKHGNSGSSHIEIYP